MAQREEHELLRKLKASINDPVVETMFALLKLYEEKATENLIEAKGAEDVKVYQGEIRVLRRVVSRIKAFDLKKLDSA